MSDFPTYKPMPIPFADSGVKFDIPQAATSAPGRASYEAGFPPETMIPIAAGGIPPYGQDMNGILNEATANFAYLQWGASEFKWNQGIVDKGGYPLGACIRLDDKTWPFFLRSAVDSNTSNPNTDPTVIGSQWVYANTVAYYGAAFNWPKDFFTIYEGKLYQAVVDNGPLYANVATPGTDERVWKEFAGGVQGSYEPVPFTLALRNATGQSQGNPPIDRLDWANKGYVDDLFESIIIGGEVEKPVILAPADGDTLQSLTPTLTVTPIVLTGGGEPAPSRTRVRTLDNETKAILWETVQNYTTTPSAYIPDVYIGKTVEFIVAHQNNFTTWSPWSDPVSNLQVSPVQLERVAVTNPPNGATAAALIDLSVTVTPGVWSDGSEFTGYQSKLTIYKQEDDTIVYDTGWVAYTTSFPIPNGTLSPAVSYWAVAQHSTQTAPDGNPSASLVTPVVAKTMPEASKFKTTNAVAPDITGLKHNIPAAVGSGVFQPVKIWGATSLDGGTVSYRLQNITGGLSFSKTSSILDNEKVTMSAPTISVAQQTATLQIVAVSSFGAESVPVPVTTLILQQSEWVFPSSQEWTPPVEMDYDCEAGGGGAASRYSSSAVSQSYPASLVYIGPGNWYSTSKTGPFVQSPTGSVSGTGTKACVGPGGVVCTDGVSIKYSPDGVNEWAVAGVSLPVTSASGSQRGIGCAYLPTLGKYFVCNGSAYTTSADGKAWASPTSWANVGVNSPGSKLLVGIGDTIGTVVVAGSTSGTFTTAWYSTNLTSWTSMTLPSTNAWTDCAWDGSAFIIMCSQGTYAAIKSTTGRGSWTTITSPLKITTSNYQSLFGVPGAFFMSGGYNSSSQAVWYSNNSGSSWTQLTWTGTNVPRGVSYVDGKYFIICDSTILYGSSPTSLSAFPVTGNLAATTGGTILTSNLSFTATGNHMYYSGGGGGYAKSRLHLPATKQQILVGAGGTSGGPGGSSSVNGVVVGGGGSNISTGEINTGEVTYTGGSVGSLPLERTPVAIVATMTDQYYAKKHIYTLDGVTFQENIPEFFTSGIAYADDLGYFLATTNSRSVYKSYDAFSWELVNANTGIAFDYMGNMVYGKGVFVKANGSAILSSNDGGVTWRSFSIPFLLNRIDFGNGVFFGASDNGGGDVYNSAVYLSSDGQSWEILNDILPSGSPGDRPSWRFGAYHNDDTLYLGNFWNTGIGPCTSKDGRTWVLPTTNAGINQYVKWKSPGKTYMGMTQSMRISTNSGSTWSNFQSQGWGESSGGGWGSDSILFLGSQIIGVQSSRAAHLFYSTNDGATVNLVSQYGPSVGFSMAAGYSIAATGFNGIGGGGGASRTGNGAAGVIEVNTTTNAAGGASGGAPTTGVKGSDAVRSPYTAFGGGNGIAGGGGGIIGQGANVTTANGGRGSVVITLAKNED